VAKWYVLFFVTVLWEQN